MRIAVLSLGSRGDVQPLVALAAELEKRGHDVRLATHANFAELAAGRGIAFEGTLISKTARSRSVACVCLN
jgi:UDP:flavonoid glycosyltransferase YjiC (YdhE family)